MPDDIDTTGIPHRKLRPTINKIREKLKNHKSVIDTFKEYDIDINEIDLVPICFANLDVSARTDHGIIYLNVKMLDSGMDENDHYIVHELTHFLQQTTGTKPTPATTSKKNYLQNKVEQEAFTNQTEYIEDTKGEEEAENYVDDVLEHHDLPKNERTKKWFGLASQFGIEIEKNG